MLPAVPVKEEFEFEALLKFPEPPEIILHRPVPEAGALALSVAVVVPHKLSWSPPAFAVVGV